MSCKHVKNPSTYLKVSGQVLIKLQYGCHITTSAHTNRLLTHEPYVACRHDTVSHYEHFFTFTNATQHRMEHQNTWHAQQTASECTRSTAAMDCRSNAAWLMKSQQKGQCYMDHVQHITRHLIQCLLAAPQLARVRQQLSANYTAAQQASASTLHNRKGQTDRQNPGLFYL